MMKRLLLITAAVLGLSAPAMAQTRALPPGEIRANGDITFGNALKLGKRQGDKTVITPDTLQILGLGSTGDVSGMSATPTGAPVARTLASKLKDAGFSVLDFGPSVGTGGDDSAAINAAIAAASRAGGPQAGKVTLPYPPSGNYNICANPIEIPGGDRGLTLEGQSSGNVAVRFMPGCTSGIETLVRRTKFTGALTNTRVHIDNITFDGRCKTKYIGDFGYTVGTNFTRTVWRNAAKGGSNVRIQGGYENVMDATNRLENQNDPDNVCYASRDDMPDYNLENYGSDSYFPGLIAINAKIANFYNANGGNVHFHASHGWGYRTPIDFVPDYNFVIEGNTDLTSCIADSWRVAGILVKGYNGGASSDAKLLGCTAFGGNAGTPAILLDTGVQNATIIGNILRTTGGISSLGAMHPSNLIRDNFGDTLGSPVSVHPLGGDTARLSASTVSGSGSTLESLSVTGNSSLFLKAQGAGSVQLGSNGATAFTAFANAGAVNSVHSLAVGANQAPSIQAVGSDTNIGLSLVAKGNGSVQGYSNGAIAFAASAPVSGVNYPSLSGAATGGSVGLTALGSDANIWINYSAKGFGVHNFISNGGTQFQVGNTASAVNFGAFSGAAAGASPNLQAFGADTNIALRLLGKGTSGALTGAFIRTADPTTADIPTGQCADWNNTTAGTFKHVCNFGGTLRGVAMN